ncbi:MAG TPA: hypothetical protein VFW13_00005, partial [Phenylobacterium sp.]|nr:hypothetical protein [Phenylobacterium sp.]
MKRILAIVLAAAMAFAPVAQATDISQFDRYAGDDQIKFVSALVADIQGAADADPVLSARVKRFFMNKQPGEAISGMGQFEMNLSFARIADLDAAAKNPHARHIAVEDVMYATLFNNGLRFSGAFHPTAVNFRAEKPLRAPLNRQEADKALAETREWVSRNAPERSFLERSAPGSQVSGVQAGVAFFAAMIALGVLVNGRNGGSSSTGSTSAPYDPNQGYRDAQRSACAATGDT